MDKTLADFLWTARWATNVGKPDVAYDELTKALVYIGAEKEVVQRPPGPTLPSDIFEPKFVEVPGYAFDSQGEYQTSNGMFDGLVVHYTVSGRTPNSAKGVIDWMEGKGYGCIVMDEDGTIYIPKGWDFWKRWDDHCGTSKWGSRTSLSKYFAGMEICCWGKDSRVGPFREVKSSDGYVVSGKYQAYTEAQEKSLINFLRWVKLKNPNFKFENVVGHDEIRAAAGQPGGKSDPGGSLSMTMPALRKLLIG